MAQQTKAVKAPFDYIFRNIDNTQGLISNDVTSLVQDGRGFMWIGTVKGLQRYDGQRFVNCIQADSTVDDNMPVFAVWPDDAHQRVLYNQACTHINQWSSLQNKASAILPAQHFQAALAKHFQDGDKKDWFLQEFYVSPTGKTDFRRQGVVLIKAPVSKKDGKAAFGQPEHPEAPEYFFGSFVRDPRTKRLYVWDCFFGLMLFDEERGLVSTAYLNAAGDPLLTNLKSYTVGVRGMRCDSRGNIWIYSWGHEFFRYHIASGKLHRYSIADILRTEGTPVSIPGWVSGILEDDHGFLWIATAKAGLLQYDYEQDRFLYLLHSPGNNMALQYNHQLNDLFQDRQGNIWIGSDRGICIFNPYGQYFTTNAKPGGAPAPITESEINVASVLRNGTLLVGNWGTGISIYDSTLRKQRQVSFGGAPDQNQVWSFLQQDDGKVWAGCQHGVLHVLDTVDWHAETTEPVVLERSTIRCMVKDPAGKTLLGLHNGKIITWDPVSHAFLPYNGSVTMFKAMGWSRNPVVNIFIDRQGRCWAATWAGINEFDREKRTYIRRISPPGINPAHTMGIADYDDSTLLIGMENAGLYFFHKNSERWEKLPVNVEQPLWSANAVRVDEKGYIWFTTDHEICVYHPVNHRLFTCHPEKGQLNAAFNSSEILRMPGGKWVVWTYSELAIFDPVAIRTLQSRIASATITGFSVFGRPYAIDSLMARQQVIKLGYGDNFFQIQFSDLQYSGITQTKYYYRLSGIDKDWVYGGTRGVAAYTNVPPGKYLFQVRTGNTERPDAISALTIQISAPFWATGWFIVIMLLLVAVVVYVVVRLRIRQIKQEGHLKQQMAQTEMMALRAQMNPHFIFNCINSIDAMIQCNDKYQATVTLNKFARLIRNILDSSRSNTIALTRDLETLQLYIDLEQFRGEHAFEAVIHIDQGLLHEDHKVPPLIIQPYVENAILHGLRNRKGEGGQLRIDVVRQGELLIYRIEDNGVGRDATRTDTGYQSHGMEMSRERVRLFNGAETVPTPVVITDLFDQDEKPAGTRVEIRLKIQ